MLAPLPPAQRERLASAVRPGIREVLMSTLRYCAVRFSVVLLLGALFASPAFGLAQRTFVASYGNDANPCSRALPCRSFGAAILQVIVGGEVIALDSAAYGPVVITQSVSIIGPAGVYVGISVI